MKGILFSVLIFFTFSCIKKTQYYKTEELIESDNKLLGNNMEVIIDSFIAKKNIDAIKEAYKRYLISKEIRENERTAEKSGTYKKLKHFSLFSPDGVLLNFNDLKESQKDSIKINVNKAIEKNKNKLLY